MVQKWTVVCNYHQQNILSLALLSFIYAISSNIYTVYSQLSVQRFLSLQLTNVPSEVFETLQSAYYVHSVHLSEHMNKL